MIKLSKPKNILLDNLCIDFSEYVDHVSIFVVSISSKQQTNLNLKIKTQKKLINVNVNIFGK